MGLSGGLSNHSFADLLQCLTAEVSDQALRESDAQPAGWSDGRRKFGTVSGAIMTVLTRADSEMRMRTIHAEVEGVLGGSVSFQSVADYLIKRSKGPKPLFVRTRYGHYRLRGWNEHQGGEPGRPQA
jgi:hypothetical protein